MVQMVRIVNGNDADRFVAFGTCSSSGDLSSTLTNVFLESETTLNTENFASGCQIKCNAPVDAVISSQHTMFRSFHRGSFMFRSHCCFPTIVLWIRTFFFRKALERQSLLLCTFRVVSESSGRFQCARLPISGSHLQFSPSVPNKLPVTALF